MKLNQARPTGSFHATLYIINANFIINTENITQSNHISAPLQRAWHEGARSSSSNGGSSSNATYLSVSDVWQWTIERCTSVSYASYGEKLDLLLSSFSTNPIKRQPLPALNATCLQCWNPYSLTWLLRQSRWISLISGRWQGNPHYCLTSYWLGFRNTLD